MDDYIKPAMTAQPGIPPGSRLDYALRYVRAGFRVLPLHHIADGRCSCGDEDCRSAGKHPLVIKDAGLTGGVHSATADAELLRRIFEAHPDANIGLAVPEGALVVDIDPRNGGDITIDQLTGQYGKLPDTVEQITGGGGTHLVYRNPAGLKLAGKLGAGVDIKQAGGYIVAEPSIHESGRAYVWEASSDPLDGVLPVEAPAWLVNRLALGDGAGARAGQGLRYGVEPRVLGEMQSALVHMNQVKPEAADDRDTWVRVGMACKSIGEAGYDLWVEWSCISAKFNSDDQWKKWQTFNPAAISYRTVFFMAQQAGWSNPLAGGQAADGVQKVDGTAALVEKPQEREFEFLSARELRQNLKPTEWLVRKYIETYSMVTVFGPSGHGKSFLALDFAFCVASGQPWLGNKVRQGAVFYIAGEGQKGINARMTAWEMERGHSLEDAPFYSSKIAAQVLDDEVMDRVRKKIDALSEKAGRAPALVVLDTVARNFGAGDENSTSDMSRFISNLDNYVRHRYQCCVMVVHHSGHSAERARGSSALRAAVDAEYEVKQDENKIVTVTCHKMKDADQPEPLTLRLEKIDLGVAVDDEGEEIEMSSCVLRPSAGSLSMELVKNRAGEPVTVLDALKALAKGWIPYSDLEHVLGTSRGPTQKVVQRCAEMGHLVKQGSGYVLTERATAELSQTGYHLTAGKAVPKPAARRPWMDGDDE